MCAELVGWTNWHLAASIQQVLLLRFVPGWRKSTRAKDAVWDGCGVVSK